MLMFMPMWYLAIFSCVTGSWVSDVVADTVVGGLRLAFRLSVWRDSGPYTCIYTGPLVPAILIQFSSSHNGQCNADGIFVQVVRRVGGRAGNRRRAV
jgi:hypothetical protein